jgi:crotonobetainyl-CoA:carnitine CoA-transferase CaiB-like acyl-CoA transferase
MSGLLEGVKVVEAAVLLTGDYFGMLLADEGAEVVKIESPGLGDYIRDHMGAVAPHYSPFHLFVNRNKKSVTLDMKRPEGKEVFARIAADADVFITGFTADTPARLGMGYEQLRAIKPDIVYAQATGFGARGPYATIPTHGSMMNALVASPQLEMVDGHVRTAPGGGGGAQGVVIGPLFAAYAVAAALYRRERTGEGCYIDVSCADAVLASSWPGFAVSRNREGLEMVAMSPLVYGGVAARYAYYETSDRKYILFCPEEKKFWQRFCELVDSPALVAKHDDSVVTDFGEDPELWDQLQEIFHTRTQTEWIDDFIRLGIPGAPALGPDELADDPHLQARGMLFDEVHPVAGRFHTLANPVLVDGQEFSVRVPSPALGEHTDEVLGSVGYSPEELADLRAAGVI